MCTAAVPAARRTGTGSCAVGGPVTQTACAPPVVATDRLTRSLAAGARVARRTDPDAGTVRLVRERDAWRCARCTGWGPLSTQHRIARGMGGTRWAGINEPTNLLTLCGSGTTMCHGWVESHPVWAEAHGWSIRQHQRELAHLVPVWTWRGWVRLRTDGHLTRLPGHGGVPGCSCGCQPTETPAGLWDTPALTRETET